TGKANTRGSAKSQANPRLRRPQRVWISRMNNAPSTRFCTRHARNNCRTFASDAASLAGRQLPGGDGDVQQPGGVGPDDRAPRPVRETGAALDKANRINFAHIGGVVGADEDVVLTVLLDEILQLVVGVDERVEIEPL